MRTIDLETWPRRHLFKIFSTWDYPHFNLCANVDITAFYPAVKQRNISFTVATMYTIARTANAIPEFRYRIRGESVIEHAVVHPSTTLLTDDELFTFWSVEYSENFDEYALRAEKQRAIVLANPTIKNDSVRDDRIYMTAIPWVSFTSCMHPLDLSPVDSVPRFAWGKFFNEGDCLKMPFSVQAHHALVDGVHVGRFFETMQATLHQPERIFGEI